MSRDDESICSRWSAMTNSCIAGWMAHTMRRRTQSVVDGARKTGRTAMGSALEREVV